MDAIFTAAFEKTAKSKWQKAWKTLSPASKQRLRKASGSGIKNLKKMREGLFVPSKAVSARKNKIDQKIYDNFRKTNKNVIKQRSNTMPYAYADSSKKGKISLPKNPSKGNMTRARKRNSLKGAEGTHNRSMLNHEKSELEMEKLKYSRTPKGKWARKQKAIYENKDVLHSSAYPLVAEANTVGKSPKALKDMIAGWKESPAQGKMFKVLKEHGWTPASGLPVYGKATKKVQVKAEKLYGEQLKKKLSKKEERISKKYRGKAKKTKLKDLKDEFDEFAK